MQLALVGELDAELTDIVGALVVGGLVPGLDALDILFVDAADVAGDMRSDFAERILAKEPRLDLHAGKAVAIDGEPCDFLVAEPRSQWQALEILGFLEQALETLAVACLHVDDRRQCVDGLVEILHPRRSDFERIGRIALRQHDTVAIGDHAAVGDDGHDGDAVALGKGLIVLMLDELEIDESAEKPAERENHDGARDQQPAPEELLLELRISQLGGAERAADGPAWRTVGASLSAIAPPSARGRWRHCSSYCNDRPQQRSARVARRHRSSAAPALRRRRE